jgi:hypothetical protein
MSTRIASGSLSAKQILFMAAALATVAAVAKYKDELRAYFKH